MRFHAAKAFQPITSVYNIPWVIKTIQRYQEGAYRLTDLAPPIDLAPEEAY